ncbi:hypothetical protein DPMN_109055 [Dreissena polymorpha]|uniref:Uncharacterized protein n=1 Tax=Dreissena polymorpha TaxID=45954 RepID=A0A9D4QLK9_DREPO|nr:hypothetical protein DPMN_109055 [Dreissena polymorpha]
MAKVIANVNVGANRQTDQQTNRQTGQKQYVPQYILTGWPPDIKLTGHLAQTNQPTNQQTNQQTGQKQYVPHYYSGGHKNTFVIENTDESNQELRENNVTLELSSDNHLVDGPTDRQTD